jgi:hypothetical protein
MQRASAYSEQVGYIPPDHSRKYVKAIFWQVDARADPAEMARDTGYLTPDLFVSCDAVADEDVGDRRCQARILGAWVDTASFRYFHPYV